MSDHDYEAGLRDGKIEALERVVAEIKVAHTQFKEQTNDRFRYIERIVYAVIGAIALVQFGPHLRSWFGGG